MHVYVTERPAATVASGVAHRSPVSVPITLASAARLATLGVPVTIHDGAPVPVQ